MRRPLLYVAVGLAAILVAGYAALWMTAPDAPIGVEAAAKIKKGMNIEDVREVFGKAEVEIIWLGRAGYATWVAPGGAVQVTFARGDGALDAIYAEFRIGVRQTPPLAAHHAVIHALFARLKSMERDESPFANLKRAKAHWVEPTLVAETLVGVLGGRAEMLR